MEFCHDAIVVAFDLSGAKQSVVVGAGGISP